MASTATHADFVTLVAQEIAFGIDHALDHWLGRIEMELVDAKLSVRTGHRGGTAPDPASLHPPLVESHLLSSCC